MKNLFALFLAISASTFPPSTARAGAWLQEQGRGEVITSLRLYGTAEFFDDKGHKSTIPLFTKTELSPYFEYGVDDKLTLGAEFSMAAATNGVAEYDDSLHLNYSYGNIFARTYLYKDDSHVISLEPGIDFPNTIGVDLVSDGGKPIPEIKINFGYGAKDNRELSHFIDARIKYRYRYEDDLNPILKSEITFGYRLDYYYVIMAQLSDEWTLGGVKNVYPGNYNLVKPQISLLYDPNEVVAQQLSLSTNIKGKNTGAGYGFVYSVWYRF